MQQPGDLPVGTRPGQIEAQLVEDADDRLGVADIECEQHDLVV
jgi:hypothetical protein